MGLDKLRKAPAPADIQRVTYRAIGILKDQDKAWVILALQRAMSSIKNKKDVKEKLGGAYHTQYVEWDRLLKELKGVDNRL